MPTKCEHWRYSEFEPYHINNMKIKDFVKKWMEGYEPETFVKNEHGNVIYSAGPSSLNLVVFFEELLKDYIDEIGTAPLNTWISVKDAMPPKENIYNEFYLLAIDKYERVWECTYSFILNVFEDVEDEKTIFKPTHWILLSKPTNT